MSKRTLEKEYSKKIVKPFSKIAEINGYLESVKFLRRMNVKNIPKDERKKKRNCLHISCLPF